MNINTVKDQVLKVGFWDITNKLPAVYRLDAHREFITETDEQMGKITLFVMLEIGKNIPVELWFAGSEDGKVRVNYAVAGGKSKSVVFDPTNDSACSEFLREAIFYAMFDKTASTEIGKGRLRRILKLCEN